MRFFQNTRLKGENSFLYFIYTVLITILFYLFSSLPFLIYSILHGYTNEDLTRFLGPVPFGLMLFVFSGLLFGILVATKKIHKRPVLSVLTGASAFRWNHLLKAGILWFIILAGMEIIGYVADPELYTFQFDPVPFFSTLLVAILILPLQTSAEEVLIRGYLMQQIGLISRYRWIPVVVTSILFGLLHGGNPEVLQYGVTKAMTLYIGMGLFFGIATIMDDGLETSLGIHYINNLFAFLIVGYKGSVFEGVPTLFMKDSEDLSWVMVISNLIVMAIVLLILKKYFKWPSFNILFKRIGGADASVL